MKRANFKTKFGLITSLGLLSLKPGFGQEAKNDNPEPKGKPIRKSVIVGRTGLDFKNPDITLAQANVLKHEQSKGLGVMSLVVAKPLNIGHKDKPTVPVIGLLAHWSHKNMNINFGPLSETNTPKPINRYRAIANINGTKFGGQVLTDFNNQMRYKSTSITLKYKAAQKTELVLRLNTGTKQKKPPQRFEAGVSYAF